MALFKVSVTYQTTGNEGARCTLVLDAEDEKEATERAHEAVRGCSANGVREFRGVVVTRNSLGVEFLGRQPA